MPIVLIICKVLKRLMILSSFTPMKWNIKVIFHGFGRVGANDWSADKSVCLSAYVRSYCFQYPHIRKLLLIWIELLYFYNIRTYDWCLSLLIADKR